MDPIELTSVASITTLLTNESNFISNSWMLSGRLAYKFKLIYVRGSKFRCVNIDVQGIWMMAWNVCRWCAGLHGEKRTKNSISKCKWTLLEFNWKSFKHPHTRGEPLCAPKLERQTKNVAELKLARKLFLQNFTCRIIWWTFSIS